MLDGAIVLVVVTVIMPLESILMPSILVISTWESASTTHPKLDEADEASMVDGIEPTIAE